MTDLLKSEEKISEIAISHKFENKMVERVLWMTLVLEKISSSKILCDDFALMGGSAIAFLYGNIYRLSVDLDIDYINNPDLGKNGKGEIEEKQKEHVAEVKSLAEDIGLNFEKLKQEDLRFLQINLNYPSIFGGEVSVELDLGYRYCHSVLGTQKVEWPNIFKQVSYSGFKIHTLFPEELWASKINAMVGTERIDIGSKRYLGFKNKIRHLYDTWYLIDRILPKEMTDLNLLKRLTLLFGVTRIKQYEFCRGESLIGYNQNDYDNNLYPVLKRDQDIPELLPMLRKVRSFLDSNIFNYNIDEGEFIIDFYSKNFRPEKIFPKEIADKIKGMYFYDEMMNMIRRM